MSISYALDLRGTNLIVTITEGAKENLVPFSILSHEIELVKSASKLILRKSNKTWTIPIESIATYNTYDSLKTQLLLWIANATIQVDNVELNNVTIDGSTLAKDATLTQIYNQLLANQNIGGKTESMAPDIAIAVSTSAYAAGNAIGVKLKFSNILGPKKTGVLHSLCLRDVSNVAKLPMEIIIFNADPAAVTDRTAVTFNAAEAAKIIRRITISSSDYVSIGNIAVVDLKGIGGVVKSTTQDLWAVLIATGAGGGPFGAATNLLFTLGVLQD